MLRYEFAARAVDGIGCMKDGWREDFLIQMGLSVNALVQSLSVPATRIHEIVT